MRHATNPYTAYVLTLVLDDAGYRVNSLRGVKCTAEVALLDIHHAPYSSALDQVAAPTS
jgi:hypothetical protein